MSRSITLQWSSSHYTLGRDDGIRIRITASAPVGLDARIFAYRTLPIDTSGNIAAYFDHVCSPPDLADYPADSPLTSSVPPWFRLAFVDVMVRSVTEAENFLATVRSDVYRLLTTLRTMDTLFPLGDEVVGDQPATPPDPEPDPDSGNSESITLGDMQSLTKTGTSEQSIGSGVQWSAIGDGAGSPVEGEGGQATNRSRVSLATGTSSQLLLVQGFDFSDLPDTAVISGVEIWIVLRNATYGEPGENPPDNLPDASAPQLVFAAIQHPGLGNGYNAASIPLLVDTYTFYEVSYGDDSTLWDLALTPEIVKDGAFGLGLVIRGSSTTATIVDVDAVILTIHYQEAT